jgi:hypothetical protein
VVCRELFQVFGRHVSTCLAIRPAAGLITLAWDCNPWDGLTDQLHQLKALLAAVGGGVQLRQAPRESDYATFNIALCDPGALTVMRTLKQGFDPGNALYHRLFSFA